jgi:hypothetical protein
MRRYIFLQTYAWTLMVMGVCVWVLTGVAVVLAIANGPAVIPLNNVLGVNVSNIFSGVLYLEVGTVALVGFLSGLSLLASGELLMLLMDIAQDRGSCALPENARYRPALPPVSRRASGIPSPPRPLLMVGFLHRLCPYHSNHLGTSSPLRQGALHSAAGTRPHRP